VVSLKRVCPGSPSVFEPLLSVFPTGESAWRARKPLFTMRMEGLF